jgi:ubiquinone/menaquinone biosynthesis C-methylase UbiE
MIKPSPGYIPDPVWWKDQVFQIIGAPMLLKRLQMPVIFKAMALKPSMNVLDIGCGSGYMTYQMAYHGATAYGTDIIKMDDKYIPGNLRGKVTFIQTDGETMPFEENFFDVILLSEVITQVPELKKFMAELKRIIKPDGRLVIVQPLERRGIREDYKNNSVFLRFMRTIRPIPADYDDYLAQVQKLFGNAITYLPPEEYYQSLLDRYGFCVEKKFFCPSGPVLKLYERIQFAAMCFGLPAYGEIYFTLYPVFRIMDAWYHDRPGTWCIFIAGLTTS